MTEEMEIPLRITRSCNEKISAVPASRNSICQIERLAFPDKSRDGIPGGGLPSVFTKGDV